MLEPNLLRDRSASAPGGSPALWNEGRRRQFLAKEVIFRERDPVARAYVVRSGLVKLLSYLPNGRARIVRLHAKDHWIGLEGLVGQSYQHTAVAVDAVEVDQIPIQGLQHLRDDPKAFGPVLHQWHDNLVQADKWISDLSTGGIKARVARLLQFLAELEHGAGSRDVELLTVNEMADMLGVTQESVSRILAAFKRSKILQKQGELPQEIFRLDTDRLRQEAIN